MGWTTEKRGSISGWRKNFSPLQKGQTGSGAPQPPAESSRQFFPGSKATAMQI
jgi:hypothetical protein